MYQSICDYIVKPRHISVELLRALILEYESNSVCTISQAYLTTELIFVDYFTELGSIGDILESIGLTMLSQGKNMCFFKVTICSIVSFSGGNSVLSWC